MCRKSRENCKKYAHMIGEIIDYNGELWKIGDLRESTYGYTDVVLYRNPIEKGSDGQYYATDTRNMYNHTGPFIKDAGETKTLTVSPYGWWDNGFSQRGMCGPVKIIDEDKLSQFTEDQLILVMDIPRETWAFLRSKPKNELNRKLSKLNSMLCGGVA